MESSDTAAAKPTSQQQQRPRGRPRKRETFTVGFRVDGAHLAALEQGAAALCVSVHEYARILVFGALDRSGETRILEEVEDTRREVRTLRAELLDAVALILANVVDEEEEPGDIRALVEKALRGKERSG